MLNSTEKLFLDLLASAVQVNTHENVPENIDFQALFRLAREHDMAHLVYAALDFGANIFEEKARTAFKKQFDYALYRQTVRQATIEEVRYALADAKIPFILLKGAVTARLYPEEWMRTSSDVDLLVKEEDYEKAVAALESKDMKKTGETAHDTSFESLSHFHIELHHLLIEKYRFPGISKVLESVWDHAYPTAEGSFEYILSDEMFYFYHIAHMVKHFENGGCGVRTVLDIYFLNTAVKFDTAAREQLLKKGNILTFALQMQKLSNVWFSGSGEEAPELEDVTRFLLSGGVYGTALQSAAVKKKTQNRFVRFVKFVFPPRESIVISYPLLKKAPWALPFIWIVRWLHIFRSDVRKRAAAGMNIENNVDGETASRTQKIMKQLGIR